MDKIAFIDRDGTLVKEPEDFQVDRLEKIEFLPDVIPSLLKLMEMNYKLVMVSNQDGRGTDSFPEEDFRVCHEFILNLLQSQGVKFEDVLICPHFAIDNCHCRKPNLGLLEKYLHRFDPLQSFVVGDRESDDRLARNLGISSHRVDQISWIELIENLQSKKATLNEQRKTNETQIDLTLSLDPEGGREINTGLAFFDHMLDQLTKYADLSIQLRMNADWEVDDHHGIEDVAIVLGETLRKLLGDKGGRNRYGFVVPMDESLAFSAIDLSGRPAFDFRGEFSRESVNGLATEMVPHFFKTLAENLKAAIHIEVRGQNAHHQIEACFKSVGQALKQAIKQQGYVIASTKGVL